MLFLTALEKTSEPLSIELPLAVVEGRAATYQSPLAVVGERAAPYRLPLPDFRTSVSTTVHHFGHYSTYWSCGVQAGKHKSKVLIHFCRKTRQGGLVLEHAPATA